MYYYYLLVGVKHYSNTQQKSSDFKKMVEHGDADIPCCGTKFSLYVIIIFGLVCFAGLMAGLTLGLMSLGLVDLEVLIKSGRAQDRIYAGFSISLPGYFSSLDS